MLLSCSHDVGLGTSSSSLIWKSPSQKSSIPCGGGPCSRAFCRVLVPGSGRGDIVAGFLSPPSSCRWYSQSKSTTRGHQQLRRVILPTASLKSPSGKGFGKKDAVEQKSPPPSSETTGSSSSIRRSPGREGRDVRADESDNYDDDEDDVVPEVVTNRMLKRIAITTGLPMGFGILLFPLFWYLKVVTKLDVPEWLPLFVSMFTFGTAGFGITYGVVSSSWDPAREGSLLGWKEAQVNWPLIWKKVKGNKEQ